MIALILIFCAYHLVAVAAVAVVIPVAAAVVVVTAVVAVSALGLSAFFQVITRSKTFFYK